MEVSKQDLLNRQEDDHRYYVKVLAPNGMYRLYDAKSVRDVLMSLEKFVKLGEEEIWDPHNWVITYRRTILHPMSNLISVPRGAVLEAKRLLP